MIRGESVAAGTEPAQTRWRKALMSRGVGLGGSSTVVGEVVVMMLLRECLWSAQLVASALWVLLAHVE